MKQILSFFLFLATFSFYGQNVIITGNVEDQPDKLIRIIAYDDLFSNLDKTIGTTITDGDGNFAMKMMIDEDEFAYLAVDLEKGEFYISPGSSYRFEIPKDTSTQSKSIFDKLPLRFRLFADDGGLQAGIEEFNIEYNDFVYNNVNRIYRSRDKSAVREFVSRVNDKYGNASIPYLKDYVSYTMASLLWLSKTKSNKVILEEYFINKPLLYNNIQYCDFFKEFFKSYFSSEKTFRYEDLIPALNASDNIRPLFELINRDSLIRSDKQISEVVAMLIMSRNYFDRYVDKEAVIEKFEFIADNSEYEKNSEIANNFIKNLTNLQTDFPAPYFELEDNHGDIISLDSLRDNFVLISFVNNDCKVCQFHLKKLSEIQQKLSFDIVSLVFGDSSMDYENYARERDIDWPVLNVGKNITLLEEYDVKVFPTYIFINPDGTIAYVHLPMPEENMELYLTRFMDRYNSRQ